MKKLSTLKIAQWVNGTCQEESFVDGIKVDTRFIEPNDLFVCLVGERVDGHDFAQQAIDNGATALIVSSKLDVDVPQIIVADTLETLRVLGRSYRDTLNAFFIGITGSNGKTSTKDILKSLFSRLGTTVATYKNQNTEIGTYLNLFRMDEDTQYGIFEMGLDYEGDVALMASVVKPNAAIVTSLAPAHMQNFNSIEHIAKEKFKIFDYVQNEDLAFYQGDFEIYRELAGPRFHTFGYEDSNELVVSDVESSNRGISFKVNNQDYTCNLIGGHQASNCAGVIGLAQKIGISEDAIQNGLNQVALTGLRTELVTKFESLVLLDAYKSNPVSAKYALELLSEYQYEGDRIAVLSDMVELGSQSEQAHKEVLDEILKYPNIVKVMTLGPEFEMVINKYGYDKERFINDSTYESFEKRVKPYYHQHVMILIKGSRSYQLERLMKEDK